jgi:hypothetical protein
MYLRMQTECLTRVEVGDQAEWIQAFLLAVQYAWWIEDGFEFPRIEALAATASMSLGMVKFSAWEVRLFFIGFFCVFIPPPNTAPFQLRQCAVIFFLLDFNVGGA